MIVNVDVSLEEAIKPKRDGFSLQRSIRLLANYADANNFINENMTSSFVIFVRHPLLDVNVFAENRQKALIILAKIFSTADPNVEVWAAPCATANDAGDPGFGILGC